SRPVIRFTEAMVLWLPVAWLMLLATLLIGRFHIFPWATVAPSAAEKRLWLDPAFLVPRDLVVFGIITVLSVWFVRTSVRLDVGILPEWGAGWARSVRAAMRRGF